jgi:hypothetical protein
MRLLRIVVISVLTAAGIATVIAIPRAADNASPAIARVLLLSIDGMHASDLDWYVAYRPDSTLARLTAKGRTYPHASATKPSDSFPGMLAMVTGGTPRSTQVYYDDSYDRNLLAATAPCELAPGTEVIWKQNLDVVPVLAPFITTIDENKLPINPNDCSRVHPNQFPNNTINNVFEVIKNAGGRTAWSDKHPAYQFLNGPSGVGIDDLFTPEIASCDGALPCSGSNALLTTNSFTKTMAYDDMKVTAIVNEIKGFDHTGHDVLGVPTLFGMNFQAVSVGQKLKAEPLTGSPVLVGGYVTTADGVAPSIAADSALLAALDHTDQSIGVMVSELEHQGLRDSTLIIISAKHGNMRIDPNPIDTTPAANRLVRVDDTLIKKLLSTIAPAALVSEDTGPLIWLLNSNPGSPDNAVLVDAAVQALNANRDALNLSDVGSSAHPGILAGSDLTALYGDPTDPHNPVNFAMVAGRIPDIVLVPKPGTLYSLTASKISDHGSFNEDDVHVALMVSNPRFAPARFDEPVETRQIACTILDALGMNCAALLHSQAIEPSTSLPVDSTAPVVSVPTNVTVVATGPGGAVVTFDVSANDPDDAAGPVGCSRASGSTFAIGKTEVTCTSTDTHNNTGTAVFTITVQDTAPVLTLPPNIMTDATSLSGAVVVFAATGVDAVDGPVLVTCAPASGSTFAMGTTAVDCTATDTAGNVANGGFAVVVLATPQVLLQGLILDNNLHQAQNLLQSTISAVNRGNVSASCGKLGAFINQVQAQSGKTLRVENANNLIAQATEARAAMGCK